MARCYRFLTAIACLLALTFCVDHTSAAAFKMVHAGDEAPSFILSDLDGNPVDLEDHREGPLTIVVFWALWSPKSEPLLQDIQGLLDEFGDKGVTVKAVAVNEDGDKAAADFEDQVRGVIERNGIKYPVVIDREMEQYSSWGVIATPSTAFLGKDLKVEYEFSGRSTSAYQDMRAELMRILGLEEQEAEAAKPKRERYQAPRAATLNYGLANTLYGRGQYSKAKRKLQKALKADPNYPDAHSLNGGIHLGLAQEGKGGAAQTARESFQKALELDATDPLGNIGMAHLTLQDGDLPGAAKFARTAVNYTEDDELPDLSGLGEEAMPAAAEEPTAEITEEAAAPTASAAATTADAAVEVQGAAKEAAAAVADTKSATEQGDPAGEETTPEAGMTEEAATEEAAEAPAAENASTAYLDQVDALIAAGDEATAKAKLAGFIKAFLNLAEGPSMNQGGALKQLLNKRMQQAQ